MNKYTVLLTNEDGLVASAESFRSIQSAFTLAGKWLKGGLLDGHVLKVIDYTEEDNPRSLVVILSGDLK